MIGTPTAEEWPEVSCITMEQFTRYPRQPWSEVLPEVGLQAQQLLAVSHYVRTTYADAYILVTSTYHLSAGHEGEGLAPPIILIIGHVGKVIRAY